MVWQEDEEVCEEDEEVEELEEMGAEDPHSSLQSGQVCRSESGNEAICSIYPNPGLQHAQSEVFIWSHIGQL